MATQTELTAEEVVARGKAIYQERIREQVEPGNIGKYLAIDIHSGEYEMGEAHRETVDRLKARVPNAEVYTSLIGYPAIAAIGTGLRPLKDAV